ncbi:hypothetical protein VM1G_12087 [Cytospora mali]|uniref:Uncharacterized protein n=1 Tax=Cytospora mali TaxID=578113 RepID=A0A194VK97_CYTMA|nr:hypothetical protein VM1G_12087 [Valsa mali]
MDHRTKPYRNVAASQQRRVIKRELELPSGAPDAVITLEGWDKATSIRLSLPCLVRCTSSSDMHKEIVELSVSTFLLGQSRYVQCSSVSWPCCEKSDLAADVDARVKEFYSAHFPPGAWIDCGSQTSMAEVDDDEADRLTVVKLVQRALAGSRQLAERGSGRLDETTVARYSHICEAIGLKHLGGPGLELSMEADVPWALSLQRLFEVKPAAHKAVQPVGEGGFIIHPQEPTLGQDSEDLQCAPAFADLAHRRAVKPLIPSKRARDHACEPEHDLENIQTTKLGWKPKLLMDRRPSVSVDFCNARSFSVVGYLHAFFPIEKMETILLLLPKAIC